MQLGLVLKFRQHKVMSENLGREWIKPVLGSPELGIGVRPFKKEPDQLRNFMGSQIGSQYTYLEGAVANARAGKNPLKQLPEARKPGSWAFLEIARASKIIYREPKLIGGSW